MLTEQVSENGGAVVAEREEDTRRMRNAVDKQFLRYFNRQKTPFT